MLQLFLILRAPEHFPAEPLEIEHRVIRQVVAFENTKHGLVTGKQHEEDGDKEQERSHNSNQRINNINM